MSVLSRRVACIALPEIRIEIVDGNDALRRNHPMAVVIARPSGSIKTERDILGGTRLDVVSVEARALGVHQGQTVAAARAKCAELRVRVAAQDAVRMALVRVAEGALSFGPTVSFSVTHDVVWVEVGGCAHLKGGERELAQAIDERVRVIGHQCRVAIAQGPRIAAAVACFAPSKKRGPFVVPEGKGAAAIRFLPIAALGLDPDTTTWLDNLGLHMCGDLQVLPKRALGTRLGARAPDVIELLEGEDRAPLDAFRPPEVPEERVELDWGASSIEALSFVIKSLCDRLAVRLEGRAMAASGIELILLLDRALCEPRPSLHEEPITTLKLAIALPAPVRNAVDLLAVVRARLERETLPAPVLALTLRASELASLSSRSRVLDLLTPEPKAARTLPRLVSELAADMGETRIGMLALNDTWVTEERTRLTPFHGVDGVSNFRPRHALVTSALEPSRLVSPTPLPRSSLVEPEWLSRTEAVQWWRRGLSCRDLFAAWILAEEAEGNKRQMLQNHSKVHRTSPASTQGGALAWVELGHRDEPQSDEPQQYVQLRGWFD